MELNKQSRVQIEDLMFLLRKDPRKYARAKDLLIMNEELKKARKAFEENAKYWKQILLHKKYILITLYIFDDLEFSISINLMNKFK